MRVPIAKMPITMLLLSTLNMCSTEKKAGLIIAETRAKTTRMIATMDSFCVSARPRLAHAGDRGCAAVDAVLIWLFSLLLSIRIWLTNVLLP
jgi:hypothetical protein